MNHLDRTLSSTASWSRVLIAFAVLLFFALGHGPRSLAQEEDPAAGELGPEERDAARVRAKTRALDTAHALAVAEGGTRRNALWEGWMGRGGSNVIPVQLFLGHRYYFVLGSGVGDTMPEIHLFDGMGRRIPADIRSGDGRAIAFLNPSASGTYYLRVRMAEGQGGDAIALTYVYR